MIDTRLAGARLVRIEYGLVADIPVNNPFTEAYYLRLEFVRGVQNYPEFYQCSSASCTIPIEFLGKIVKHQYHDETENKMLYEFTDRTILPLGSDK